jgi:hypothetical protein
VFEENRFEGTPVIILTRDVLVAEKLPEVYGGT